MEFNSIHSHSSVLVLLIIVASVLVSVVYIISVPKLFYVLVVASVFVSVSSQNCHQTFGPPGDYVCI